MSRHILKTFPNYFQQVWDGEKTFEVRFDDRGYQRGDVLVLREFDRWAPCTCGPGAHRDDCERYSGRTVTARVGCVLASTPARGNQRGFQGNGYVILSLCEPTHAESDWPAMAKAVIPRPASPADVAAQVAARQAVEA